MQLRFSASPVILACSGLPHSARPINAKCGVKIRVKGHGCYGRAHIRDGTKGRGQVLTRFPFYPRHCDINEFAVLQNHVFENTVK